VLKFEKSKPRVQGIFGFSCEYHKFLEGFKSVDMLELSKVLKGKIFVDNQQIANLKAELK